jgi:YHS domain-containing protein
MYDDYYNEWYDDHWHYYDMHYTPANVYVGLSCNHVVVQVGNVTYYQCGSVWYDRVYYQGEVHYVEISTPKGAEVKELKDATTLEVSGKTYYISNHAFYERIKREGQYLYVVVDPPLGTEVASIPKDAVEIKVEGATYYQYDKVFYRKAGDPEQTTYVIVASPF